MEGPSVDIFPGLGTFFLETGDGKVISIDIDIPGELLKAILLNKIANQRSENAN